MQNIYLPRVTSSLLSLLSQNPTSQKKSSGRMLLPDVLDGYWLMETKTSHYYNPIHHLFTLISCLNAQDIN